MENPVFCLEFPSSILTVYKKRCVIVGRKTLSGFISGRAFDGTIMLHYKDVISVQYEPPTDVSCGFIWFIYANGSMINSIRYVNIPRSAEAEQQSEEAYRYIKKQMQFCKT